MEIVLSSLVVPNVPNPVSYCMRDIVTIGETEVLNNYSPLRRESAEEIRNAEIENILQQRPRTRKQSAQLMKKQTDGSSSSATVNSKSASVLPSQDETIIKTRSNKKQKGRKAAKYERPARTKKQRLMSSYQVFMQFIKTVNDEPNGGDIISGDCFAFWKETRDHELLYPEESFRRTLIAHIRGAYGRKPFVPSVEASLLRILRQECDPDDENYESIKTRNPWERCFKNNSFNIGKRGFNKMGYHESRAKQMIMKQTQGQAFENKQVVEQQKEQWMESSNIESEVTTFPQSSNVDVLKIATSISCQEVSELLQNNSGAFQALQEEKPTLLQQVINVFQGFYSPEELESLRQSCRQKGFHLVSPAVSFFLQRTDIGGDARFDTNFLLPSVEQRHFFPDQLVGELMFNLRTWTIENCNLSAMELFQRDITGLHPFHILESPLEFYLTFIKSFPLLKTTGEVWTRGRVLLGDGTRAGFLFRAVLKENMVTVVQFQDQSSAYGAMLSTPMFL